MVGEDRLQRWGNFQRLIIMLHSPRVRIIKHRIRNQWSPDRENLLFLPRGRQEILPPPSSRGPPNAWYTGTIFSTGIPAASAARTRPGYKCHPGAGRGTTCRM